VVLHCAGPFIFTARPMMEACIRNKVHYLGITGEIDVFEMGYQYNDAARNANIMLMPGTGFDVVPTDCTAVYLKNKLPDAIQLKLAFATIGGAVSHGTATTMAENLGAMGKVRQGGKLMEVPIGHKTMEVPFSKKKLFTMTIPWGDVSTAYRSTGIPNIETYTSVPRATPKMLRWQKYFNWLMRSNFVKNRVRNRINNRPTGPTDEAREKAYTMVWGAVKNEKGQMVQARLSGPEGYTLTAHTSLIIAKKVLLGNAPVGFQTPAKAYGPDLIMELDGVVREDL